MNKTIISSFFKQHNYKKVKLSKLLTGHITLPAKINNQPGLFILDSGASATVVDFIHAPLFKLNTYQDSETGAGAGASGLLVHAADNNQLKIASFTLKNLRIAAMDLQHVTAGLQQYGVTQLIHGVIGADFLQQANAVIDYKSMQLFIKAV
jgi:predicted aspartyl protease